MHAWVYFLLLVINRPSSSTGTDLPVPVLTSDPTLLAVVDHCEQLAKLILDLKHQELAESQSWEGPAVPGNHRRECVPKSVQELIINWLGGINLVSLPAHCQAECVVMVIHRRKRSN